MKKRNVISKVFQMAAWLVVICGLATLLIAANRKEKTHVCKKVSITILGGDDAIFIQKEDIFKQINAGAKNILIHQPVASINLARLERSIERNPWIRKAELYFDNKDILNAVIMERIPVARVITQSGNSFYLDSSGQKMPLLEQISARVPVITGFTDAKFLNGKDSITLEDIRHLAVYISKSDFWNAQIGQIEIKEDGKFEMIPVIGDHVIRIGYAAGIEDKLSRLYVFYKQVMSKIGFNKYSALDLEYDGQVVALKKGPDTFVDSLQLKKNIEILINKTDLQNAGQEMLPDENAALTDPTKDKSVNTIDNPSLPAGERFTGKNIHPATMEAGHLKQMDTDAKVPKAIMKKMKNQND